MRIWERVDNEKSVLLDEMSVGNRKSKRKI